MQHKVLNVVFSSIKYPISCDEVCSQEIVADFFAHFLCQILCQLTRCWIDTSTRAGSYVMLGLAINNSPLSPTLNTYVQKASEQMTKSKSNGHVDEIGQRTNILTL